jgi:hypothetical protein
MQRQGAYVLHALVYIDRCPEDVTMLCGAYGSESCRFGSAERPWHCRLVLCFVNPKYRNPKDSSPVREARSIIARMQSRAAESGNKLGNLYPTMPRDWWPLIEDIFASPAALLPLKRSSDGTG